uniref:TIL domain-containing protein n=1 Tax=Ornithodoros turicata TaxID=34597 RepID=A0A2R5LFF1_9ACAR
MKTAAVLFAASLLLTATYLAETARQLGYHECHRGAVYSYCASPCPRVCGQPPVTNCSRRCIEGCTCEQGLILDPLGRRCIHEGTCDRLVNRNTTRATPVSNVGES